MGNELMNRWKDGTMKLHSKKKQELNSYIYNVGFIRATYHQTLIHCGTFSHRFNTVSALGIRAGIDEKYIIIN